MAVKIKALKGSLMTPGKIYQVSDNSATVLINSKKAVKALDSEKIGEVYSLAKPKKSTDSEKTKEDHSLDEPKKKSWINIIKK